MYDIHGVFEDTSKESFWSWNVACHEIAQYNFMREIFPESLWNRKEDYYMVYHGSNVGGRPWTEMVIYRGSFPGGEPYNIFWRIDTDNAGPYISLRFYDDYNKNCDKEKTEHIIQYRHHREQVEKIMTTNPNINLWTWEKVVHGKTENYKESTLLHIHIDEILREWNVKRERFVSEIKEITDSFIKENIV